MRRLLGALLVLLAVTTVVTVSAPTPAEAAVVRSFTPRYRINERGDIYAIGNTLVTCVESAACTAGRAGGTASNNDFIGAHVDVDGVAATVNSSRATLELPPGGTVLWAGLYWAGSAPAGSSTRGTIQLAGPSGGYAALTATTLTTGAASTLGGFPYAAFADVTARVQTSGTYTVGGLTTTVGASNSRGGWSLVVVVRDTAQPLRNLSVFDGYAEINSSKADSVVTTNVSGFLTPASGTVTARTGAVTSEGDVGLVDDSFAVNGTILSDPLNPASNFWNSSITRLGTRVSAKQPDYANQLGFDIDYLAVPPRVIGNGQTSATLRFTTGGESYEPIALFFAVDIYEPNMAVTKTVGKVGGGTKINPGDTLQYTMNLTSSGSEAAATSVLSDPLPAGLTFVPGSIAIGGTAVTDATGDDRGEYIAASRSVRTRIGTGASASAGGSLAVGSVVTVTFRVTVNAAPAAGLQVANQASVAYTSPTTGTVYATLSDDPGLEGVPNATTIDVNDPPVTNPVTTSTSEDTALVIDVAAATSDADDPTLTFGPATPTVGAGSVSCTPAGRCTYTPPPNYSGSTTFGYTATDAGGLTSTSTVTISVNAVNDRPVAANDSVSTAEDTAVEQTVTANDTDIDGGPLTVSAFTQAGKGTVACVAPSGGAGPCTSGALRYTPNADANGTDTYTYVVSDGAGGTATATVVVTVTPVNDAPVATPAAVTTREDTAVAIDVLAGDSDKDGDTIRLLSFTQPPVAAGSVECPSTCTFRPAANFNGTTSFTYTITDRSGVGGLTSTATVTVTVSPVNDLPVAVLDTRVTPEDTAITIPVLANDSDPDAGTVLSVASWTAPTNGTVSCVPGTGACTYTPRPNYAGPDTFTYELADGDGGQVTGRVNVTVTPVNDPPVAVADAVTTSEDQPVTIVVVANDTDVEGATLTVTAATQPVAGAVTCLAATTCTYTPPLDFTGTTTFTYTVADGSGGTATATVTVTVTGVNDPPVADGDVVAATEDTPTAPFDVIGDDTDPDDDEAGLQIVTVSQPARGTVSCGTLPGRGPCTYSPLPNTNGPDAFTYTISDPGGASSTATVVVDVAPVNDPPTAPDSTIVTEEDVAVLVDITAGVADVDGPTLGYTITTPPGDGTVVCPTPSSCTYTPGADFNGTDTFTFTVSDGAGGADAGTVTVRVAGVNDPPTATPDSATAAEDGDVVIPVLPNDTDPDADALTVLATSQPADGTVSCGPSECIYTPNADFNGTDTFTYTVSDGRGGTATASVTVTVAAINDPPSAVADSTTTAEDEAVIVDVVANDRDVDGDTLILEVIDEPDRGTVACTASGSCTYTPDADANGTDSFTYELDDGAGGTATATVTVNVSPVNDAPIAATDAVSTDEDAVVVVPSVLANDTDVDTGDSLSLIATGRPTNGTVTCTAAGSCTYTPNPNFAGVDRYTYTVSDGSGQTSVGTVDVTVVAINDAPTADDDGAATAEDTPVTIDVADGDGDIDSASLTWTVAAGPTNGSVVCSPAGSCTYTPSPDVGGLDSFTYTVSDGALAATATVTILVDRVNDAPVADDDDVITREDDVAAPLFALVNDVDPDGDVLTISGNGPATNGTAVCGTTTCSYTPNRNFSGTDSFTYLVSDGNGAVDVGTITITVDPVNDAPVGADQTATTAEDVATTPIDVLAGATDVDGDAIVLVGAATVPPASEGTVACGTPPGTCTFTPGPDFVGTSSFTVTLTDGTASVTETVTVTVVAVGDPPSAAPDGASVAEDGAVTIPVLANDSDPDIPQGDSISVVADAGPRPTANGTVTCSTTACTYTPRPDFNGADAFTYDVEDESGAAVSARVTVTVTPVNDAPTPGDGTGTTEEDTPLSVPVSFVLANDTDPDGDALTAISFTQPPVTSGSVTCTGTPGAYLPTDVCTFTPAADFRDTTSFTYTVRDPGGLTGTAVITVVVGPVNDAPVANPDVRTTPEDTPISVDVLINDTDVDGDVLTVRPSTPGPSARGGVVTCSASSCTYTPPTNFVGIDTFVYAAVDPDGADAGATVTVDVTAVNDRPTPGDGTGTTNEDTPLSVPVGFVLQNDTDPDGDPLTAVSFTEPPVEAGSVTCSRPAGPYLPTDICTFSPAPDFAGTTTFTYTVTDPGGLAATATITVVVVPVNDAPVAVDDVAATAEDTPSVPFDIVANDRDVDDPTRTVASYSQPANGTVTCSTVGVCTYTPNGNFAGTDSFAYEIVDGSGGSATATVIVTVASVNDPPAATGYAVETDEEIAVSFSPADGDVDVDGGTVTLLGTSQPAGGTVECVLATGVCTYTPGPGFNGTDTFTYTIGDGQGGEATGTVTVTVDPVNDQPVAVADDVTTDEDTPIAVAVLLNDTDVDTDELTISSYTQPAAGSVVCDLATGGCTYTPNADSVGDDAFTYTVSDGEGGSATATARVTVRPINDAPVAPARRISLAEGAPAITILLRDGATDVDADDLTVTSVDPATAPLGTLTCSLSDAACVYDPGPDAFGSFDLQVTIADGNGGAVTRTITVTVDPVNDPPVPVVAAAATTEDTAVTIDVLAGAGDVDPGDSVSLVGVGSAGRGTVSCSLVTGSCTYTPDRDVSGDDTFTYTVTDEQGAEVTRTVTVTVLAANDAPVATDVVVATDEDTPVPLDVLGGASDVDGDALSATLGAAPTLGSLGATCPGTPCSYTPAAGVSGTDTFTVVVADGNGGTVTRTFTVVIAAVNDVPVAVADSAITVEDVPIELVDLLDNDTDADGDPVTIVSWTAAADGTVSCSPTTGVCSYTPNANRSGTDSFTYSITDGNGGTSTTTVTVTVGPVNDPPTSTAPAVATAEDTAVDIDLLEGAGDVDGDPVSVVGAPVVVAPGGGTIACTTASDCTYTPAPDASGAVTIRYTITDGIAATVVDRVIVISGAQDPPRPAVTATTVAEDAELTIAVLAGAADPDGDPVTFVSATPPANGTLLCDAVGVCVLTPRPDFFGTDSFTYTVTDGNGNDVTTTVTVTVTGLPDAPTPGSGSASTSEDTALVVPVGFILSNDTDPDGDPFEAISFEQPPVGTGTAACDPADPPPFALTTLCTFTPAPNFTGSTSFTYTVRDSTGRTGVATITVIVTPVNDAPAVVGEVVTTDEDVAAVVDVLANDVDVDDAQGDLLVVAITQPRNGTVSCGPLPGRGPCTFTPAENANGPDSFTYVVSDGSGSTTAGTVAVTVVAVDDAPLAADRVVGTIEDTPVTFDALGGVIDPDGTAVRLIDVTQPANGIVVCDLATGACTYTPSADFAGTDPVSVTVGVVDATGAQSAYTITFDVAAVADPPAGGPDGIVVDEDSPAVTIDVLANDRDPEGAPIGIARATTPTLGDVDCPPAGPCTYTPRPDANGTDTFTYFVSDGVLETAVLVTVEILPLADPPVAADDAVTTDEDTEVVISVLANDSDPDGGAPGDLRVVRPPLRGELRSVAESGELAYIPADDYAGPDDFEYEACDPDGACDTATVTITVAPIADDPVAEDLTGVTLRDRSVAVSPLETARDADDDLDIASLALTGASPAHGSATVDPATSTFVYTPAPGYVGPDAFGYTICDARDVCVARVVNIEVLAPDEVPVTADDAVRTSQSTPVVIAVLDNDASIDIDRLDPSSVQVVAGPASGDVVVDPSTGALTYTPNDDFAGVDTITYRVSDVPRAPAGEGELTPTDLLPFADGTTEVTLALTESAIATVTITVDPAAAAPPATITDPDPAPTTTAAQPRPRPRPGGRLPSTGTTIAGVLLLAAVLVAVGAALRSSRRRPTTP